MGASRILVDREIRDWEQSGFATYIGEGRSDSKKTIEDLQNPSRIKKDQFGLNKTRGRDTPES